MSEADDLLSLSELRAKLATVEPVFSAADRARRGAELEILSHVPTLLGIVDAAYVIERERLHHLKTQCCDCGCYRHAVAGRVTLRKLLGKVKP